MDIPLRMDTLWNVMVILLRRMDTLWSTRISGTRERLSRTRLANLFSQFKAVSVAEQFPPTLTPRLKSI